LSDDDTGREGVENFLDFEPSIAYGDSLTLSTILKEMVENPKMINVPKSPTQLIWNPEAFIKGLIDYCYLVEAKHWRNLFSNKSLGGIEETRTGVTMLCTQIQLQMPKDHEGVPIKLSPAGSRAGLATDCMRKKLGSVTKLGRENATTTGFVDYVCAILCKIYGKQLCINFCYGLMK